MSEHRLETLKKVATGELTPEQAHDELFCLSAVSRSTEPQVVNDLIKGLKDIKRMGLTTPFLRENKEIISALNKMLTL